jgi:hypothetical protein
MNNARSLVFVEGVVPVSMRLFNFFSREAGVASCSRVFVSSQVQ